MHSTPGELYYICIHTGIYISFNIISPTFNVAVYLSDICKSGDHVILFHAQEMATLPSDPYPCKWINWIIKFYDYIEYI